MAEPRQIFDTRTLTKIREVVEDLTKDNNVNTTIKYRKFNEATAFNPENQSFGSMYTDTSGVSSVKGNFSDREVILSGGMLELGDVRYLVDKNAISGILRTKDIIVDSGVSLNVKNIWTDPLDISYVLQGREV